MGKRKCTKQDPFPPELQLVADLSAAMNAPLDQVLLAMQQVKYCCLCQDIVDGNAGGRIGIFIPDNPQQFGAPEHKLRWILYGLCEVCLQLPHYMEHVEETMARDYTRH